MDSRVLRRLTDDPAADVSPAWSPDGRTIAFIRKLGGNRGATWMLVPAAGGPEHKVRELRDRELSLGSRGSVSLAWSRDGAWIAAAHSEAGDSNESIYLFSATGDTRKISDNHSGFGDHTPAAAFSPDGRALAFSRLVGFSASEIYTLRLNANYYPEGEARRLTAHKRWSVDPVWLSDGRRILYVTADEPGSLHELRMVGAFDGATLPAPVALDEEASGITAGKHLVYSRIRRDTNIWRVRIPRPGEPPPEAELFISSTSRDEKPSFSPDGQKIAFTSTRSGSPEIWIAKADGGNAPVRMTTFGGPLMGYAKWSPDGQWLTFHARPEGQADVFVMPSAGGPPKRLTTDPSDDIMPSYSHDGRWIYFSSSRSGQMEIWRMNVSGASAERITSTGGEMPLESPDGKRVFYLAPDKTAVRSVPVDGGPSTLAAAVHPFPSGFALTSQGLYYGAPPHSGESRFVMFASFLGGWNQQARRAGASPFLRRQ